MEKTKLLATLALASAMFSLISLVLIIAMKIGLDQKVLELRLEHEKEMGKIRQWNAAIYQQLEGGCGQGELIPTPPQRGEK